MGADRPSRGPGITVAVTTATSAATTGALTCAITATATMQGGSGPGEGRDPSGETPATYRDLVAQATTLVEDGRRSTAIRMDDRDSALSVVTDRHAVLSALEAHVWALIGPGRAAGVRSALHPDPVEAAALHLGATITDAIGVERPHPSLIAGPHGAWGRAAQAVRAANDLVSVHHDAVRRAPQMPKSSPASCVSGRPPPPR